jgi:hypothetical protein
MTVLVATVAAPLAVALFGVSTALQHRSVGLVGAESPKGTGIAAFVSGMVRHRLWVVGSAVGVLGFALYALAPRDGPLTLVQPRLASSVLFALCLRQLLEHRRSTPRCSRPADRYLPPLWEARDLFEVLLTASRAAR